MRRITFKILLASLACLLGVGLTTVWHRFVNGPLSLCEISRESARYDGRVVRVRGPLYGSEGGVFMLTETGCGSMGAEIAEVSLCRGEHMALAEELRRLSSGDYFGKTEVVITGKLEDRQRSCFAARLLILADEVEQLTPAAAINYFEERGDRR